MSDIDFESDSNSDSEYESDFDTDSDTNSESNPTPKITPNLVPNSSKKYSPVRYRNSSPSVSIESSFSSTSQNLEDDDIIEDPEKDSDQGFEHLCVSNLECIQKDCIICYYK